jgi:thiol-disulfide isomerase/thioredoxin
MTPAPRSLLTRVLPAALIVVCAGMLGFLAFGWVARRSTPFAAPMAAVTAPANSTAPQPKAAIVAAGRSQADRSTGPSPPAAHPIPSTLPDVKFKDRRGAWRRLTHWRGRALLVNFWAAWCSPCREEIPLLERLSRERAGDSLQVIGVAVDSRAAVLSFARRARIEYPLLIGERAGLEAIRALGMEPVFPFSVFVDARGQIVTLKVGELHADEAELILDRIDAIDRGRLSLASARQQIAAGISALAIARAKAAAKTAGT